MSMLLASEKETGLFSDTVTGHLGVISQAMISYITHLGIPDLSYGMYLTHGLQLSSSNQ